MTVEANAKVNFTLEVFGKRADGYHALRSVVMPISLSDTLDIEVTDDGEITSDTGYDDDLCIKAARILRSSSLVPRPSSLCGTISSALAPIPFSHFFNHVAHWTQSRRCSFSAPTVGNLRSSK